LEFDSPHALALANISGELTQLQTDPVEGPKVLAELLLVEDRPERLTRLLRVWAGRSARAIRGGSFELALKWLEVVSSRTDLDPRLVDEAYRQVVTDEVFDIITGQDVPGRAELLEALSQTASSRVLDSLAVEEDPGRRRVLIDVVADIARVDSRSIVGGLSDPRWYVVRNLATALGKSGRRAVAEPLSRLLQHDDHRVRIEAARALLPCMGDEVVDYLLGALTDEHVRVRATVTDLLKTLNDDVVVPALEAGLRDATGSVETRVAMIEALGARGGPIPQRILAELAGSRAGYSSAARTLRSAARKALRSSDA
jgi:HEAT repeat protein